MAGAFSSQDGEDLFGDLISKETAQKIKARAAAEHAHEVVAAASAASRQDAATNTQAGTFVLMTKDELEHSLQATVKQTVEATFGQFVRSLRLVLEDMGKRIDASHELHASVTPLMQDLKEQMSAEAARSNARFSSVDSAVKEALLAVQVRHVVVVVLLLRALLPIYTRIPSLLAPSAFSPLAHFHSSFLTHAGPTG